MSSTCPRCVTGKPSGRSKFCRKCNEKIDAILKRSLDGDVGHDELAEMRGLSIQVVAKRRSRLRPAAAKRRRRS